ncbi:MAG: tRNA pseudouridine(38-40) synthase TruA [SAR324 cluster bacterium]
MRNLALLLTYDGSAFQGWQVQPHGPTVQGKLQEAVRIATRVAATVHGSGRTDAGVHAEGQVANVQVPAGLDLHKLQGNLNGLAGPHISVRSLAWVPDAFHARRSAIGKTYRYRIHNRPYPSVLDRRSWWIRQPLDVRSMRQAAAALIGEHDFSAFRAKECEAVTPVRTLRTVTIGETEGDGAVMQLEFHATAFLQHMVRILTGTLVAVGLGKLTPEAVAGILASRMRERAAATAPPEGLHLIRVHYDLAEFPALAEFLHP